MKLNDYFKKFVANISLNPTRIARIESAITNWETKFKEDEELKDKFIDYYTQGSYSTDTGVRPKGEEEFDVDVVLVLDISEADEPKETLNWIKDRIKSHKGFENRVKAKDRCVRIDYAKDFHVDVVPAFVYGDYIKIPSKKESEWTKTNPTGFKDWCDGINNDSDDYFSKTVKVIKHWRDEKVGKDTAPKSILLTTLVGNAHIKKTSIAETLVETLDNMKDHLRDLVNGLEENDDVPFVENPSLADENLARNWTKLKAQRFLNKLTTLKEDCQAALDEKNKEESIKLWQDIFGSSYFPSELGEASNMARSIQSGSVLVSSTGELNSFQGTPIKEHRFYGEGKNE
ncbi:SMODS domain-containing nucleotidyltransferase [Metabacillus schmidteae]|uniref:SMODS domain-containing nucleotidyltransferase n=1 Tax=Metabacillus schmidteae TaxID=2730405 RepID=UPI001F27EFE7|nr:nucleotidyltransferase [Metabacillus schmidteae]